MMEEISMTEWSIVTVTIALIGLIVTVKKILIQVNSTIQSV